MKNNKLRVDQQEANKLSLEGKTDSKVLINLGIKFVFLYFVLLMFDVLLDGLMMIFDFLVELIHILIEIVELLAEEGVEMVFHTEHHQSETILLNLVSIIALILLYYFIKALPHLIVVWEKRLLNKMKEYWRERVLQWHLFSIGLKLKFTLVYILGSLGLIMLLG